MQCINQNCVVESSRVAETRAINFRHSNANRVNATVKIFNNQHISYPRNANIVCYIEMHLSWIFK